MCIRDRARELPKPFVGIYGACSSFCLSMAMSSLLIEGGFVDKVIAMVSSHNATAERQYRYPCLLYTSHIDDLEKTFPEGCKIAILAISDQVQETVDRLMALGVKGIVDFTHSHFTVHDDVVAVSYTHLDVYKRQAPKCATMILECSG